MTWYFGQILLHFMPFLITNWRSLGLTIQSTVHTSQDICLTMSVHSHTSHSLCVWDTSVDRLHVSLATQPTAEHKRHRLRGRNTVCEVKNRVRSILTDQPTDCPQVDGVTSDRWRMCVGQCTGGQYAGLAGSCKDWQVLVGLASHQGDCNIDCDVRERAGGGRDGEIARPAAACVTTLRPLSPRTDARPRGTRE